MGDPTRWLADGSPEMREFVEAGGYGTFAGWVPEGGFMTSNTDGRPPAGSYFKEGKYLTIGGTDSRMVPPDYEVVGVDEAVVDGDVGAQRTTPGRMILKRKERPAPAPAAEAKAPAPEAKPQPEAPSPRLDASNPSLAAALVSAQQLSGQARSVEGDRERDPGRRYAASDRWRKRMDEVSSRFA